MAQKIRIDPHPSATDPVPVIPHKDEIGFLKESPNQGAYLT